MVHYIIFAAIVHLFIGDARDCGCVNRLRALFSFGTPSKKIVHVMNAIGGGRRDVIQIKWLHDAAKRSSVQLYI